MRADSTFTVSDWTPAESPDQVGGVAIPTTGASAGLAYLVKTFDGDIAGRSVAWFLGALNEQTGEGTYAALEAVDAVVGGRSGTFNLVHTASMAGGDQYAEQLVIVPGSGTGELTGITGSGALTADADGTHRLALDYELS